MYGKNGKKNNGKLLFQGKISLHKNSVCRLKLVAFEELTEVNLFNLWNTGVSPRFASIVYQGSPRSDTNENNMQLEAVGCSLSNTSCDDYVPDENDSPRKNKTQVSSTSLINIPRLSMFEVSFLRGSPSTTGMIMY